MKGSVTAEFEWLFYSQRTAETSSSVRGLLPVLKGGEEVIGHEKGLHFLA